MRTFRGVVLAMVCLGLASCSLFGKKHAQKDGPRPFPGSEPARTATATTSGGRNVDGMIVSSSDPLPNANGVLAGRVMDRSYHHPSKVLIQVEDLHEVQQTAAKLEVQSDDEGYFTITDLKLGHQYRLIARSQDGSRLLSGSTVARPPLTSLSIFVSEENTTPATPPLPPTGVPGRAGKDGGSSLDPPQKSKPEEGEGSKTGHHEQGTSSSTGAAPTSSPLGVSQPDLTNVVEGFQHGKLPAVNVPGPVPPGPPQIQVPPPPDWTPVAPTGPPSTAVPPPPPGVQVAVAPPVHLPQTQPRVPSCSLEGNYLYTFTLRDLNGQTWDYRRDHRGKLTLVDFWFTTCRPCVEAIRHLEQLNQEFGPRGLEVIGIACEQMGSPKEHVDAVRSFYIRHGMHYRILMSEDRCPVRTQMQVSKYPTLFLFDEAGRKVWQSEGLDSDQLGELRSLIRRKLDR